MPKVITLIAAIAVLLFGGLAYTAPTVYAQDRTQNEATCAGKKKDGTLRQLGDHAYMHDCLHTFYEKMYVSTKCHCHTGYCRPTIWRDSPRGTEIKIDGHWYTFKDSTLRDRGLIPEELWPYQAHVCARPTGKLMSDGSGRPEQDIECTVINSGT